MLIPIPFERLIPGFRRATGRVGLESFNLNPPSAFLKPSQIFGVP